MLRRSQRRANVAPMGARIGDVIETEEGEADIMEIWVDSLTGETWIKFEIETLKGNFILEEKWEEFRKSYF